MRKTGILFILLMLALLIAVPLGKRAYRNHVLAERARLVGDAQNCLFVGAFIQGDYPVVRLVGEGDTWFAPGHDFRDAVLNSEQAKPFHFGLVLVRGAGADVRAEIWGWSYRLHTFWTEGAAPVFNLLYGGDVLADCLAAR